MRPEGWPPGPSHSPKSGPRKAVNLFYKLSFIFHIEPLEKIDVFEFYLQMNSGILNYRMSKNACKERVDRIQGQVLEN